MALVASAQIAKYGKITDSSVKGAAEAQAREDAKNEYKKSTGRGVSTTTQYKEAMAAARQSSGGSPGAQNQAQAAPSPARTLPEGAVYINKGTPSEKIVYKGAQYDPDYFYQEQAAVGTGKMGITESPKAKEIRTTAIVNDVVEEGYATYKETPSGFALVLTPEGQAAKSAFMPALQKNLPENWEMTGSSGALYFSGKPTTVTRSNELLNPAWRAEGSSSGGGSSGPITLKESTNLFAGPVASSSGIVGAKEGEIYAPIESFYNENSQKVDTGINPDGTSNVFETRAPDVSQLFIVQDGKEVAYTEVVKPTKITLEGAVYDLSYAYKPTQKVAPTKEMIEKENFRVSGVRTSTYENPYDALRRKESERNKALSEAFSFKEGIISGGDKAFAGKLYREGSWGQDFSRNAVGAVFSIPEMGLGIGGKVLDIWQYKSSSNEEYQKAASRMASEDLSGTGTAVAFAATGFYLSAKENPVGAIGGTVHWWTTELIPTFAVGGLYGETFGVVGKEISQRLPTKVTTESYNEVFAEWDESGARITAGKTAAISRAEHPISGETIAEYKGGFSQKTYLYEAKEFEGGFQVQGWGKTEGVISVGTRQVPAAGEYFLGPSIEREAIFSEAKVQGGFGQYMYTPQKMISPEGVYTKFYAQTMVPAEGGVRMTLTKGVIQDLAEFNGMNIYEASFAGAGYGGPTIGRGYMAVYNPFSGGEKLTGLTSLPTEVSAGGGGGGLVMAETAAFQGGFRGIPAISQMVETAAKSEALLKGGQMVSQAGQAFGVAASAFKITAPTHKQGVVIASVVKTKPVKAVVSAPSVREASLIKPITITREVSISKVKPAVSVGTGIAPAQKQAPSLKTSQLTHTSLKPAQMQPTAQLEIVKIKPAQMEKLSELQITKSPGGPAPTMLTPPPIIPPAFEFGSLAFGSSKVSSWVGKQSKGYRPSVLGQAMNFKVSTTPTKTFTGGELRPMVTPKKGKKKGGKWF